MKAELLSQVAAWLTQAGLAGAPENAILDGFCERCVAAGLPLSRAHVLVDTLHPVHEGRMFRWGQREDEPALTEYGRTSTEATGQADAGAELGWTSSPFYRLLQTGETSLRRKLGATGEDEFPILAELRADGVTDYVAIVHRFGATHTFGEMDCIYSSWSSRDPGGFRDDDVAALEAAAPYLALALKSVSLTHMLATLMQTYLGRDAARRVLSGRIVRGVADRIDAAIWFSDLRGFTRITDTAPEQVIPLLNAYADVIVSAIHRHGGDVLKLIGDGTLAIFAGGGREQTCSAALAAAVAAQEGVAALNRDRAARGLPVTEMYLGLHAGEVFYGNVGSLERLDFTVIGPAVNEASRIASMCRSADQPVLVSSAFAEVGAIRRRLVSVGRYALRGVGKPQELFTLDAEVKA